MNSTTRFYSAHTTSHYAIYWWWPGASERDRPTELLEVFDISSPSAYRPSENPPGGRNSVNATDGPMVIRQMSNQELDFYVVSQRSTPNLRSIELDENHVYFIEEGHRWLTGRQVPGALPTLHNVKSTGVPFEIGPRWVDECGASGDLDRSFCGRKTDSRRVYTLSCPKLQHVLLETLLTQIARSSPSPLLET